MKFFSLCCHAPLIKPACCLLCSKCRMPIVLYPDQKRKRDVEQEMIARGQEANRGQ